MTPPKPSGLISRLWSRPLRKLVDQVAPEPLPGLSEIRRALEDSTRRNTMRLRFAAQGEESRRRLLEDLARSDQEPKPGP